MTADAVFCLLATVLRHKPAWLSIYTYPMGCAGNLLPVFTQRAVRRLTAHWDAFAGTDMALAFVARHHGEHAAEEVAGFLEYTGDFRSVCSSK